MTTFTIHTESSAPEGARESLAAGFTPRQLLEVLLGVTQKTFSPIKNS